MNKETQKRSETIWVYFNDRHSMKSPKLLEKG